MHLYLVVQVKKMSVLINFLMQNTNLVSVLSKFCCSCLTGLTNFENSELTNTSTQYATKIRNEWADIQHTTLFL